MKQKCNVFDSVCFSEHVCLKCSPYTSARMSSAHAFPFESFWKASPWWIIDITKPNPQGNTHYNWWSSSGWCDLLQGYFCMCGEKRMHLNWFIARQHSMHGDIVSLLFYSVLFSLKFSLPLFSSLSPFRSRFTLFLPIRLPAALFYSISHLNLSHLCHCRMNSEVRTCHAESDKNRKTVIRKTMK